MKDNLVIYEEAEDGSWDAHTPDVEGVDAAGISRAHVEQRIVEAFNAHVASLHETGRIVPEAGPGAVN
jgi:predicted RNase H-like HicB family nuclease